MEGHGLLQRPYPEWKATFIKRLNPVISKVISKKTKKEECMLRTGTFVSLENIRKEYYLEQKTISRNILDKLDTLGLCIWYLDDGYLCDQGRGIRLSTCCFSIPEHEIMIQYFREKWKLTCKIEWTAFYEATQTRYPYLKFLTSESYKMIDIIKDHVIPSMDYKINPLLKKGD